MKNTHLASLIVAALALPTATFAAPDGSNNVYYTNPIDKGVYVQGDVGLAHVRADSKFDSIKQSYNDSKFLPRASVGYDFGNVRVAGDYTYYGKVDEKTNNASAETKAQGVGVSAIYDFPTGRLQPYVGARLAANNIKRTESNASGSVTERNTKLGAGVLAGIGYQIDNNVTLDAGYRYNHLDSNLNAHEATVGVRYKF